MRPASAPALACPGAVVILTPENEPHLASDPFIQNQQVDQHVVPLLEERLDIATRTIVTGTVKLEKSVEEYSETLDIPLAVRNFEIERVVLNRPVDAAPPIRQEGDTTIYSLVEEQLVITRQLILKEEVRVTRRDTERRDTRTVTLHRDRLDITRSPHQEGQ